MKQYRSYKIPDPKIGFYGTGINKVKVAEVKKLEELLEPIQEYLTNLLELKPARLSLRFLGYHDEVKEENLEDAEKKLLAIYKDYLPITIKVVGLSGSWQKHPKIERQLLFADIESKELIALHKEILRATTIFPIFQDVEGTNFKPHITLAELQGKYGKNVPEKLTKYLKGQKLDIDITFKGAYIWLKKGIKQLL